MYVFSLDIWSTVNKSLFQISLAYSGVLYAPKILSYHVELILIVLVDEPFLNKHWTYQIKPCFRFY
jgi:hypothetical protein